MKLGRLAAGMGVVAGVTLVYATHLYIFHALRHQPTTFFTQVLEALAHVVGRAALAPLLLRATEVFVANVDGADERNLSRSAGFDGWPMWSPDGRWILFASNRGGRPLVGELFVVAPDGSAVHRISSSPESLVQPAWFPDGRKILAAQYTLDEEAASIVVLEVPQAGMR